MHLVCTLPIIGAGKRGHYKRGLFRSTKNSESLKSLEPLENGLILLRFRHSEGSLESLESRNFLESLLKIDKFVKLKRAHFSKDPVFLIPNLVACFAVALHKRFRIAKVSPRYRPSPWCSLGTRIATFCCHTARSMKLSLFSNRHFQDRFLNTNGGKREKRQTGLCFARLCF